MPRVKLTVSGSHKKKNGRRNSMPVKKIKKICNQVISSNLENKVSQFYEDLQVIYPVSNTGGFANSVIPLTPYASYCQIQQGVGQTARIGNRIKIKSIRFKGIVFPLPYDATTNAIPKPVQVIMWIFHARETPTEITAPNNTFLDLNNGAQALSGTLYDSIAEVNTDKWVLHKRKVFKVGFADFDTTTGGSTGYGYFANNDYKFSSKFSVDITKYCVKHVKFNDNNSTPTTRGVFCVFQAVNATGTAISSAYEPAAVAYTISTKYEDA